MKVTIKEWTPVGYWVWDVKDEDDICGICQNAFDGVCGACDEPGDQCPLLYGVCSHIFHMHCIIRWTEKMQPEPLCPLCKRKWEEVTANQQGQEGEENQGGEQQAAEMAQDMQENVPTASMEASMSMESEA